MLPVLTVVDIVIGFQGRLRQHKVGMVRHLGEASSKCIVVPRLRLIGNQGCEAWSGQASSVGGELAALR